MDLAERARFSVSKQKSGLIAVCGPQGVLLRLAVGGLLVPVSACGTGTGTGTGLGLGPAPVAAGSVVPWVALVFC